MFQVFCEDEFLGWLSVGYSIDLEKHYLHMVTPPTLKLPVLSSPSVSDNPYKNHDPSDDVYILFEPEFTIRGILIFKIKKEDADKVSRCKYFVTREFNPEGGTL